MSLQPTILVVDDDPDIVAYVETLLRDNGFRAVTAEDGDHALQLAREQSPALICLDISMPPPSGVRVYRELKADPALAGIPVVMVTGVPKQFEDFIGSRRQVPPPDGYLSKPFDPDELLALVRRLVGQATATM